MRRFIPHRSFEALEAKRMNAANLLANALAAMPATSSTVQTAGTAAGAINTNAAAVSAGQNVSGSTHLTAPLSGTGQGLLNLVSGSANGSTRANFLVHLTGAPANQTFDVSLGGNV